MSKFNILQLSDTHFRQKFDDELNVMGIDYFPPHVLETFISTFSYEQIDCIVITGDLVHEGTASDYQAYQHLLTKYVPASIPIYYTLGNHDRRDQFYAGMTDLQKPRYQQVADVEKLYDYCVDVNQYRLIMVDNYDPKTDTALISKEQSEWIGEQLEQTTQHYAVLFMHHPLDILIHDALLPTLVSKQTRQVLQHPKLLGVFTGHVHANRASMIGMIPQWTAPSVYGGFHPRGTDHYYTNHLGFNIITLEEGQLQVFSDIITPTKKYYRQIEF